MFSDIYYENWPLVCDEIVDDGQYIWFSYMLQNGVYRVKKNDTKAEYVSEFPGQDRYGYRLYKSMIATKDKIIFAPFNANQIAIYDKLTGKMDMVSFKKMKRRRVTWAENGGNFWTSFMHGDYVYMLGHAYPGILKLNINTYKIDYIFNWVDEIEENISKENKEVYLSGFVKRDNIAFIPVVCMGAILELNLNNGNTKLVEIQAGIDGFNGIADDGKYFWLCPRHWNPVVKFDPDYETFEKIEISSYGANKDSLIPPYYSPIILGKNIVLMPIIADEIIQINCEKSEVSVCNNSKQFFLSDRQAYIGCNDSVSAPCKVGDKIFFINDRDGVWHLYSPFTGEDDSWNVLADDECSKSISIGIVYKNYIGMLYENKRHTLESYIFFILSNEMGYAKKYDRPEEVGSKIYSKIIEN